MAHRHAARIVGALMTVGAVVVAGVAGTTEPTAALGVVPLLTVGVLFLVGGFRDSVSVGPMTVPWYGLVGAGFVGAGVYMLTGAVVASGSFVFGQLLPAVAGLCFCWFGIRYARGTEHVGSASGAS